MTPAGREVRFGVMQAITIHDRDHSLFNINLEIVERLTLGARDLAERFLFGVNPLDRFALLVEREGWLPAEPNTVCDGAHPALRWCECR